MAVALIDNFLELQWLPLARLQLLGITALLVASKFEERFAPHVSLDRLMEQLVNAQQNHCESGMSYITFFCGPTRSVSLQIEYVLQLFRVISVTLNDSSSIHVHVTA